MRYIILVLMTIPMATFLYLFFKNEYDLDKTIKFIKLKFGNCCIKNKKELDKKVTPELKKVLEDNFLNIDSCENPLGDSPLDICVSGDLDKNDIELRSKVAELIAEQDNFVLDGGQKKKIVPLSATIFLTKEMNPVVNEKGEILIISETTDNGTFDEVSMFLKDSNVKNEHGELIYKDSEEIIKLLKTTLEGSNLSKNQKQKETIETKKIEDKVEENDNIFEKTELNLGNKEEEIRPIEDSEDNPFGMNENPFAENNDDDPFAIDEEIDFDKLLLDEIGEKELDTKKDDNIKEETNLNRFEFYENIKFERMKELKNITKSNYKDRVEEDLENELVRRNILFNLIKTKPLIFSKNKEYLFVDIKNIYFAYSKLFGIESKNIIRTLINSKEQKELYKLFSKAFENEISDIVTGNKRVSRVVIEDNGDVMFSYGLFLQTDAFKKCLSDKDFDFFRQFPYETKYKIRMDRDSSLAFNVDPKRIEIRKSL